MERRKWVKLSIYLSAWLLVFGEAPIGSPAFAATPMHKIAVLTPGLTFEPILLGLREGMERLGYVDGKNVTYLVEDTKGDMTNLESRATRLIDAKPDLLFSAATAPTSTLKHATESIPIVFAGLIDPVQSGFVASLVSSGNNLTGVSANLFYQTGKRLEVLKAPVPQVRKVLAMVSTKEIVAQIALKRLEEAGPKLAVKVVHHDVAHAEDLDKLLARRWAGEVDAVFYLPAIFIEKALDRLTDKSHRERLPLIVHDESLLRSGALASYGTDVRLLGEQVAKLVIKVLKGVKPSELPIETPDRLALKINRNSAKAMGLKIPDNILERADRILD